VWIPTICLEVGICEETHTKGVILVGICQRQYERGSIRLIASIIMFICLVISTILAIFFFLFLMNMYSLENIILISQEAFCAYEK
jgi:hypothetical protein